MKNLTLQICTYDGVKFDGEIISVTLRTSVGDVCILNNHANYMAPIESGKVIIKTKTDTKVCTCCKGVLSVVNNAACIISSGFEFEDKN